MFALKRTSLGSVLDCHSWKSIVSWRIAQKDGRLKTARIGSNGDVYQMFETRLGILVQTLIWKTCKHGQRGAILLGGRELVRGLRGTRTFHLFHLVCKFPWIFAWFGFLWVLLCLVGVFVLVGFCFRGNLFSFFTHSSC